MDDAASTSSMQPRICPQCHTILDGTAEACPYCELHLRWLALVPQFSEALKSIAASVPAELIVDIRWHGGDSVVRLSATNGSVRVPAGPLGEIGGFLDDSHDHLVLSIGDRRVEVHLPGQIEVEGIRLTARIAACLPCEKAAAELTAQPTRSVNLATDTPLTLGRSVVTSSSRFHTHLQLFDSGVEPLHCVIVRQPDTDAFWIADRGTASGTFLNRRPILAQRLEGDDLIQIGGYGWIFNRADRWLVPVDRIEGATLQLRDVSVRGILESVDLTVRAGEFVGIVGHSGSGKSTLLHAILGQHHWGRVLVDGQDTRQSPEALSTLLGFVSQKDVLHGDLTVRQALRFSAALRQVPADNAEVDALLRRADLSLRTRQQRFRDLSGGENQRVRIAAELIARPRLFLLDEPGAGLDRHRERSMMRWLRVLSQRGCTTVVVTHNLQHLDAFDRVVLVRDGSIAFDGEPEELRRLVPSRRLADLDFNLDLSPLPQQSKADRVAAADPRRRQRAPRQRQWYRQLTTLVWRELQLACNDWTRRLALPLLLLPLVFATAIGLAVKPTALHLLGFLSVLSCIWMGSSLSLLSIANERDVYEHERLLFLRPGAYVAAKMLLLSLLASLQVGIFVLVLSVVRGAISGGGQMLHGTPFWIFAYLVPVALAAVGLGLLISAAVGNHRPAANFVLPLVMLLQIVFSVFVAGQADGSLASTYGEFHPHRCQQNSNCRRRATAWTPAAVAASEEGIASHLAAGWSCRRCRSGAEVRSDPHADRSEDSERPPLAAVWASYGTLSRYGDILLRSFAYLERDANLFLGRSSADSLQVGNRRWRREALAVLLLLAAGFCIATVGVLRAQERVRRGYPSADGSGRWRASLRHARRREFVSSDPEFGAEPKIVVG